jgi:hypothetical protein
MAKSVGRGLAAVMALVYGPLLTAYLFVPLMVGRGLDDDEDWLFGLFLIWSYLFVPHIWAYPPAVETRAILKGLHFVQWAVAGIVLGAGTRASSNRRLAWLTVLAIAAVALVVHLVFRTLGYHVAVEGP